MINKTQVDLAIILHSNSFGGTERHTIGLLSHIDKTKKSTVFFHCGEGLKDKIEEYKSVSVEKVNSKVQNTNITDLKIWLKSLRNYKAKKVLLIKPSYFSVDIAFIILIKLFCKNVFIVEHSLPPARPEIRRFFGFPIFGQWWIKTEIKKFIYYLFASHIITVSERAKIELLKHTYYNDIKVFGNGLDISYWKYDEEKGKKFRKKYHIDENMYLFGCVGNLFKLKAFHIAIEALSILKKETKQNFGLCISGVGPENHNLLKLVKDLDLNNVFFVGKQIDMISVYSAIQTLLITSTSESSSLVALEAAACGCNLISSNVGICSEVIDEVKNGIVIESDNPEIWANEISNYLHLSYKMTRQKKREQPIIFMEKYDLNNTMDKLFKFINNNN